jgi:hypothetical protein
MDANKSVIATFNFKPQVRLPGPAYYATIDDAYHAATGGIIEARNLTFTEALVLDRLISVTLDCGKDASWNTSGYTSVNGSLSIVQGSVTINNLIIQ